MNIMQVFQGILLIFMLFGLLLGLWRGFGKSLIRFLVIIPMAIIAFFITPPISNSLVNANISNLNIVINDTKIYNIQDGITESLSKVETIGELMEASPTFKSFVQKTPSMALNIVVFLLSFIVLTLLSLIISWIISRLVLKKTSKEDKNKFRLLGGLIGIIQGIFVFAVITVSISGLMNIAEASINETNKLKSNTEQVSVVSSIDANETTKTSSSILNDTKETLNKYISDYNDLIYVKAFNALGIEVLQEKVFNSLTTTTINKERVQLKKEIVQLAKISANLDSVTKFSTSSTKNDYQNMKTLITDLFDTNLLSRIAEESIKYIANRWQTTDEQTAFGIKKPSVGKFGGNFFNEILDELQNSTRLTLKNDLLQTVSLIEAVSEYEILDHIVNDSSSENLMNLFAQDEGKPISDFIEIMLPSKTLKAVLPELVQTGLDTIYPTIDIPTSEEKEYSVFSELSDIITNFDTTKPASELASKLEQNMSKNMFDFSNVTTEDKNTWFDNFARNMINSQPTTEEIKEYLSTNPINYSINGDSFSRYFSDMENCGKKTQEELSITNVITDEQWIEEKTTFSTIFSNIVKAYDSTKQKADGSPILPGEEFDNFDFNSLGKVFDALRNSYLLDDKDSIEKLPVADRISFNIVKAMLQSSLMKNINITQTFIEKIEDNWDDPNFNFEEAFSTLGSTIKILNSYKNKENLSADDVNNLLNGLKNDSNDFVKDILKDQILDSGNSTSPANKAVKDIVDHLANQDISNMDADKEAKALNSTIVVLEQVNEKLSLESISEDVAKGVVDDLLESDVVFGALIDASGTEDNLKIKASTAEDSSILHALENKEQEINSSGLSEEQKAAQLSKLNQLKNLFF